MCHVSLCVRWTLGLTVPKHGPIFERLWCLTSFLQEACIVYLSWWSRPQTTEVHYEYADRMMMYNVKFAIFFSLSLFFFFPVLKNNWTRNSGKDSRNVLCSPKLSLCDLQTDFPLNVSIFLAILVELTSININTQWCVSQTQQNFIMFIIVLGQHVSILIESSSGPSKKIDPYLICLKMCCGIQNTYILDKTMHVSFCKAKRHMHFLHSFIKNVSVLDPTAHF